MCDGIGNKYLVDINGTVCGRKQWNEGHSWNLSSRFMQAFRLIA